MDHQREMYRQLTGFIGASVLVGGLFIVAWTAARGDAGAMVFWIGVLFSVLGASRLAIAVRDRPDRR